jgi:hypothetical protein
MNPWESNKREGYKCCINTVIYDNEQFDSNLGLSREKEEWVYIVEAWQEGEGFE